MSAEPTLYLVDGTYLLFRAYHSLPSTMAVMGETYKRNREGLIELLGEGAGTDHEQEEIAAVALEWLRNPAKDRLPTNAIRGLTSVLVKLLREERPALIGVAFDLPGRVHRDDHYDGFSRAHPDYAPQLAGYKATRPETPVDLNAQFPLARIVCRHALGIPVLEAVNYEADDLIGTLARRARRRGLAVRLVTADKDLFQLVGEGISIVNPHKPDPKGPSGYLLMDSKVVERDFGVPPEKVVDVLALMGDTSDNIPGVPGIGEKGARDLIARFGSVEACLEAAKEEGTIARNAYRKGLLEHAPLALLSKELATIREDAPIAIDVDDLRAAPPDPAAMKRVFTLLSFESFLRDASVIAAREPAAQAPDGAGEAPKPGGREGERTSARSIRSPGSGVTTGVRERPQAAQGSLDLEGSTRAAPARREDPGEERFARWERVPAGVRTAERDAAPAEPAAAVSLGGVAELPDRPRGSVDESAAPASVGSGDARRGAAETHESAEVEAMTGDEDRYRPVLDLEELASLLPSMLSAPRVAVDTETTSEDPMRAELVGISIAWEPGRAIYVPVAHRYLGAPPQPDRKEVLKLLAPLLEAKGRPKTGQNVKYDIEVLARAGVRPAGFDFDTMIAAFLLQPDRQSFGLAALAKEYLADHKTAFSEVAGKGAKQQSFDGVDIVRAAAYSGRDADVTLRLANVLAPRLAAEGLDRPLETMDMPLVEVLAAMETTGVRIDVALLDRLSKEMAGETAALRAEIHRLAGHEFNVDSPKQLAKVLFEEIGLQPVSRTTKSGEPSTRDEDLEVLAARHALPGKVREYRTLEKLRSTYVDALPRMVNPETGRVHTSFHPTGAATGRLSSSDPNLQNIPVRTAEGRKIRAAFVPREDWTLISADYSQIELRVLAHLSEDPALIEAFSRGEDIHRSTAARIFGVPYGAVDADQRRAAKTINFGILYGMGPVRLARDLAIPQAEAKALIGQYFGRFPRIREYIDGTIARAEKDGFVSTLFGRIRRFPELSSTSRNQRQMAVRAAVNSTIQGTAADIMKLAMIRLHGAIRKRAMEARLLIQVHDELVLEAPPGELPEITRQIRDAMEHVREFRVPLIVEVSSGPNWLEAKP